MDNNNNNHGTVRHNDQTLDLLQDPYRDHRFYNDCDLDGYFASAVDDQDNEYLVFWEIANDQAEDESEACDWTDYVVFKI
jgi:hypothetical protein